MVDPTTQTHRYIMDKLKADPALTAIIPTRNFIDLTRTDIDPMNRGRKSADFPFVILEPTGKELGDETSHGYWIKLGFELVVATESMQTSDALDSPKHLYPVDWEITRVLKGFEHSTERFLTEGIVTSVGDINIGQVEYSLGSLSGKGKQGWVASYAIEIEMLIDKRHLNPAYTGDE